jgi:hypothetical protein
VSDACKSIVIARRFATKPPQSALEPEQKDTISIDAKMALE